MKMLFEIPSPLAKRFKAAVPTGRRSAVVSRLLERALGERAQQDEDVCRRVNRLRKLSAEMEAWERFDDIGAA